MHAKVSIPIYSEKKTTGWAYKVDLKQGKLEFISKAKIDLKAQQAAFSVEEGGDYVVLTKKIHKDAKKTVDIKSGKRR